MYFTRSNLKNGQPVRAGKDDIYRIDILGELKGLYPPKDFDLLINVLKKENGENEILRRYTLVKEIFLKNAVSANGKHHCFGSNFL